MCNACGFPSRPGHWADAGLTTPHDRLRARFTRAALLQRLLRPYGLTAHDDGLTGLRLSTLSGASVMVIRPGFVRTKMTEHMDDGPMATTAQAVAVDIVAGLRKGSHTVWSPAKLRPVFAVLKLLPRPLWRKLAARQN